MSSKTVLKWSKQITTSQVEKLIRAEKNPQRAILVFDSATSEYPNGYRHDLGTFSLMISKLVSANQFTPAEELLKRMKDEECEITEEIFLSICRGYGRVHKPMDAVRIFQKMSEESQFKLTEKSYITVLSILVDENQLTLAMRFYRYMRKAGISASVVSLNVLIKSLCKSSGTIDAAFKIFHEMPSRGCDPDSITYGTLISGLCKLGRIKEACQLFKEMEIKGCLPTVVTYTCLIHGLCRSEKLEEAVEMFKEMSSKGLKANVFTYSALIDGLCKYGCALQALKLLEMMVGKGLSPNTVTYSSLIHGLCKEGKVQEALSIYDRMKLQNLKPDAGLHSKIIHCLCDKERFIEAANFIDEMVLLGVQPNRLTWGLHVKMHNTVVQGLCCGNDHNQAFNLYLSMRTRGISVEPETFDVLVKCCCKKGELLKLGRVVEEMVIDGCVPSEAIWTEILSGLYNEKMRNMTAEIFHVNLIHSPDADLRAKEENYTTLWHLGSVGLP